MGKIKFALQIRANGKDVSSIAINDVDRQGCIEMRLFCEGCGNHTNSFKIGTAFLQKCECTGCGRTGSMLLQSMVGGFSLKCNGQTQQIASMECSQLVPDDSFLKVQGIFTFTCSDGVEHKVVLTDEEKPKSIAANVKISHEFVRK